MNSIVLLLIAIFAFAAGYFIYAKKISSFFEISTRRSTPAVAKFDGVDFVPSKNWFILFGHHFSSISGAGPIIGPVIGCIFWGWLPSLVWVVLGAIFIGGVHDFVSLIISVREGGSSMADISKDVVSKKAKFLFCVFVWLALILVIAVFVHLCAKTFVTEPKIILPSLGLIPIAVLFGFLVYVKKFSFLPMTLLGLSCLALLILLGEKINLNFLSGSIFSWTIILLVYSFIASVLPVNILLQPRDYLCSFLMIFGIAAALLGLFISRPVVGLPAFVAWNTQQGMLWPMMCVTIACGAISGFHSIVASGTTSKQIPNERYAKRIGYGGMILEGLLALIAILAVVCGISGEHSYVLSLFKEVGPISVFGKGFGGITKVILGSFGISAAILMLNAFILTTLDTATRVCRYITEELTGISNRFFSTFIIIVIAGVLALSGAWNKIWPVFGASNQLVASLTLFIAACWLLLKGKNTHHVLIAAIFMFITTVAALVIQIATFFKDKNYVLMLIAFSLLLLALIMLLEVSKVFLNKKFQKLSLASKGLSS